MIVTCKEKRSYHLYVTSGVTQTLKDYKANNGMQAEQKKSKV